MGLKYCLRFFSLSLLCFVLGTFFFCLLACKTLISDHLFIFPFSSKQTVRLILVCSLANLAIVLRKVEGCFAVTLTLLPLPWFRFQEMTIFVKQSFIKKKKSVLKSVLTRSTVFRLIQEEKIEMVRAMYKLMFSVLI